MSQDNIKEFHKGRLLTADELALLQREPYHMFTKPLKPILNKNHPLSDGLIGFELFTREIKMKATLYNWALSAKEVKLLYEHPSLFKMKCFWSEIKRIANIRITFRWRS